MFTHRIRPLKVGLSLSGVLIAVLTFCQPARPQNADPRPIAKLVTTISIPTKPRRVTSAAPATLDDTNAIERRAFEQTNLVRQQNGLAPLSWDADLWCMARLHSENMARVGFVSHVTPEGLRLRDRARAVGIQHFDILAENIAYNLGYNDPGGFAVERWMISPGHRANILYAGFKAMAIGSFVAADGSVFLTQVFISR